MNDTPSDRAKPSTAAQHELGRPRTAPLIALSDTVFFVCLSVIGGAYVLLVVAMLAADCAYMLQQTWRDAYPAGSSVKSDSAADGQPQEPQEPRRSILVDNPMVNALADRKIQYSIWLSLISCTLTALLSVFVAVPIGYLLSRHRFIGKRLLDAVLDIPIVLPPLVVGLSLLILFQFAPFSWAARSIVYQVPAVILAQFAVAAAFAVRTMKATFDHIDPRCERVALSLGCSRFEAFGWVVLPEAGRGMMTALTLAWARALGEFGPLLIFAGATRLKTEVLSTSVFLELNVGNIEGAVAVSMIMVVAAVVVLVIARLFGAHDVATI